MSAKRPMFPEELQLQLAVHQQARPQRVAAPAAMLDATQYERWADALRACSSEATRRLEPQRSWTSQRVAQLNAFALQRAAVKRSH